MVEYNDECLLCHVEGSPLNFESLDRSPLDEFLMSRDKLPKML